MDGKVCYCKAESCKMEPGKGCWPGTATEVVEMVRDYSM